MTDDEFKAAEEAHQTERKSKEPATRGYVTRSVDALASATARAIKGEVEALRRSANSTELLLADLDERLAAIEARLQDLDR